MSRSRDCLKTYWRLISVLSQTKCSKSQSCLSLETVSRCTGVLSRSCLRQSAQSLSLVSVTCVSVSRLSQDVLVSRLGLVSDKVLKVSVLSRSHVSQVSFLGSVQKVSASHLGFQIISYRRKVSYRCAFPCITSFLQYKLVKECASYLWKSISQLRSVTCRMGSHSVTCHPTQANTPRLYPSQTGWYSIVCLSVYVYIY